MKKFPSLKCPICGKVYKEVGTFGNHMRKEHPGTIPEDWTDLRYAYFIHTGKEKGTCSECGAETAWNETSGKYSRLCSNPNCKKQFRDRVMAGMRKKYGQANMLEDPSFRERMLTHRRISGEYQFADGGKVAYMGTLEKAFLKMLDTFFHFPSSDIMSPSPNRYLYYYENENDLEHVGQHMYVPDFFIPSLNLEIELKSSDNQRPRNLLVDVPKDAAKDIAMIKNPMINYCKVYENDYYVFFQIFADLANQNMTGEHRPIKYISRSLLTSVYRDYIPNEYLRIIDQYIYKYSEKDIMKKPANESEAPMLEEAEYRQEEKEEKDIPQFSPNDIYQYELDAIKESEKEEDDTDEVGINPMMYYQIGAYASKDAALATESFSFFDLKDESMQPGLESIFDRVSQDSIDGRATKKYSRWRDRLFGSRVLGKAAAKTFTKVTVENGRIFIKGVNCNLLLYRIKEYYTEAKLKYIFEYKYNERSWKLYQKKILGKGDMKIDYVYAPEFFALELVDLFRELGDYYYDQSYIKIAQLIYEATWLSKADSNPVEELDLAPLKNIRLSLMDHQVEFIQHWPQLLNHLNLRGYILSFKPGQGKTLTSIGLAECLKAEKVYIVCPNNLKDNWALEIKKYYAKYDNEQEWMKDVCILGTKYGNPKTARFIITNNEAINLMDKVAKRDPDSLFILDESHNFRNYEGIRSTQLFNLVDKIDPKNVLCVSATPIKAVPAEIVPALRLIDKTFTDEAANMYAHCFDLSNTAAMTLVTKRFGMSIYNPSAVKVDLPPRHEKKVNLDLDDTSRYLLSTVHEEIIESFNKIHKEFIEDHQPIIKTFTDLIRKYSLAPKKETDAYLFWVINSANSARETAHELAVKEYKAYIDTYIRPNTECPSDTADNLLQMEQELINAARSSMGQAVGMLPKRRAEMYSQLYLQNREYFYEKIRQNTKKTIIFSTMVSVVETIAKDLNDFGIGTVMITGKVSDRLDLLTKFKEDPNTLVLVATSTTMGTGMTFTEASQVFFFGTPWRGTDFEQAWSRVYRIGQTAETWIYTVMLNSTEPNLSDRMQTILDWSINMFSAALTPSDIDESDTATESFTEAMEIKKTVPGLIAMLSNMGDVLSTFKHGIAAEDHIVENYTDEDLRRAYKTITPGYFYKTKAGTFFDFQLFQDYYIKSHSYTAFSYLIEVLEPVHKMHAITTVYDGNWILYPEFYLGGEDKNFTNGIYAAKTLDEICSFVANSLTHNASNTKMKVYRIRAKYGWCDERYDELMDRIYSEPIRVKFIKEATDLEFAVQALLPDVVEEQYVPRLYEGETNSLNEMANYFYSVSQNNCDLQSIFTDSNKIDRVRTIFEDANIFNGETHRYFSDFAIVNDMRKALDRIPLFTGTVGTFCVSIDTEYGNIGYHPYILLPFRNECILLEAAMNSRSNGIYIVKTPEVAIHTLAMNILQLHSDATKMTEDKWHQFMRNLFEAQEKGVDKIFIKNYPLTEEFWNKCDALARKDVLSYLNTQVKPAVMRINRAIWNEYGAEIKHLPRLEVLNYGWRICRF